jgi:ribose transport system ATP-binding protein
MTNDYILEMRNISKAFSGVQALVNVDFSLKRGEVHALVGENGAGKSTLIKILSGIYKMDFGKIILESKEVNISNPFIAQNFGLSFIHQELNLVPSFTVLENVFLGREPTKKLGVINWKIARDKTKKIFEDLNIELDMDAHVRDLSISEKQNVMIVKAFSIKSVLMVMDEPTQALSQTERMNLFKTIASLKQRGISIIYISHYLEEIFEIADRVTVLRDGKRVETRLAREITPKELVNLILGKRVILDEKVNKIFSEKELSERKKILSVQDVSRKGAVEKVSFDLHEGEILGIVGGVGAGKTEVARILFGVDKKDIGNIYLDEKNLNVRTPYQAVESGICLLPENRREEGLLLNMTVRDNITLSSLSEWCKIGGYIDRIKERKKVQESIKKLNIKVKSFHEYVRYLSGGNQQKIVLAKWLLVKAKVLILDEPLKGIDVGVKENIRQIIRDIADKGIAIIHISSESPTSDLLKLWDRVLVMYKGRITAKFISNETSPQELLYFIMGGNNKNKSDKRGEI